MGSKTHINISIIPRDLLNPLKLSGFRMSGHAKGKKFYIVTFQCIYVFQDDSHTKHRLFPPTPSQMYFYNEDAK